MDVRVYFVLFSAMNIVNNLTLKPVGFKQCDPKRRYRVDAKVNFTGDSVFGGIVNLTKPFENPAQVKVEISRDDKKYIQISKLYEKNFCKSLSHFGGRLWNEIERVAKVTPLGECPIKPGVYIVKNYKVDMTKSPLFGLPEGILRITVNFLDRHNGTDGCYVVTFQNN